MVACKSFTVLVLQREPLIGVLDVCTLRVRAMICGLDITEDHGAT